MSTLSYDSYTEARAHFKDLLDAAAEGRVATLRREKTQAVVVDAARMRHFLAGVCPSHAVVVHEAGGWSMFFPGLPIGADGNTIEEAIGETIDALREYAEDWQTHLLHAPNHAENWGLVQLISLSTDSQLREWLVGTDKADTQEQESADS